MSKEINNKFAGIQISPISFIDEGVDNVLDTLQNRVGINVLLIGTVSWLGLKSGRSVSWKIDGWPDHGIPEPFAMKGGAYFDPNPKFYNKTFIKNFKAQDKEMINNDILMINKGFFHNFIFFFRSKNEKIRPQLSLFFNICPFSI